jgi:hypothetical protein
MPIPILLGEYPMKVLAELPENAKRDFISGGLFAWIVDDAVAHWNINVPGEWQRLHTLKQVGSYVSSFVRPRNYRWLGLNFDTGIYRLIGLDEGKPASLHRICGTDETGTLYIGVGGKNLRSRLSKLVRSLRAGRNEEHHAGARLRQHAQLSQRFPTNELALTWCYSANCHEAEKAENSLRAVYLASFGELPPLNRSHSFGG